MLRLSQRLHVPGTVIPGNRHARADAQAHKNIHKQVDQRAGGGNRGQRFMAGIVAHHNHIRRVIQKLQDTRQDQRSRKGKDPGKQRAFRHVDFTTAPSFPVNTKHDIISLLSWSV